MFLVEYILSNKMSVTPDSQPCDHIYHVSLWVTSKVKKPMVLFRT